MQDQINTVTLFCISYMYHSDDVRKFYFIRLLVGLPLNQNVLLVCVLFDLMNCVLLVFLEAELPLTLLRSFPYQVLTLLIVNNLLSKSWFCCVLSLGLDTRKVFRVSDSFPGLLICCCPVVWTVRLRYFNNTSHVLLCVWF